MYFTYILPGGVVHVGITDQVGEEAVGLPPVVLPVYGGPQAPPGKAGGVPAERQVLSSATL